MSIHISPDGWPYTVTGDSKRISTVLELAEEIKRLRTPSPAAPHIDDKDETIDRVCRGVASWLEGARLREYIGALERQNTALNNLAANLQPGPISQALSDVLHSETLEAPIAWMDSTGCVIPHALKMLGQSPALQPFSQPLYKNRDAGGRWRWAVQQLLDALPVRRDWLNPEVEKVLRDETGTPA